MNWLTGIEKDPGGHTSPCPVQKCQQACSRRCGSSSRLHPDGPHGTSLADTRWFWLLLLEKRVQTALVILTYWKETEGHVTVPWTFDLHIMESAGLTGMLRSKVVTINLHWSFRNLSKVSGYFFPLNVRHLPSVRRNVKTSVLLCIAVSSELTWRVLKAQLNVLPKPTAVVIHDRLGIPERLQKGVHLLRTQIVVFFTTI